MLIFSILVISLLLLAASFIFFGLGLQEDENTVVSDVSLDQGLATRQSWGLFAIVGLVIISSVVYASIGNLDAIQRATNSQVIPKIAAAQENVDGVAGDVKNPSEVTDVQVEKMVATLAEKLEKNPDDAKGWRMLARSYETLKRFSQAVDAYQKLVVIEPGNPEIWTDYAVTLAMSKEQTLVGEPEKLIQRALALDPNYVQALALYGSAAFERKDYDLAIVNWSKILKLSDPDSDIARSIVSGIERAKQLKASGS